MLFRAVFFNARTRGRKGRTQRYEDRQRKTKALRHLFLNIGKTLHLRVENYPVIVETPRCDVSTIPFIHSVSFLLERSGGASQLLKTQNYPDKCLEILEEFKN